MKDAELLTHIAWARRLAGATVSRRRLFSIDRDDAEGIALLELVKLARRFDERRGVAFRTLAFTRIVGAIVDAHRHRMQGRKIRRAIETGLSHKISDGGRWQRRMESAGELVDVERRVAAMLPKLAHFIVGRALGRDQQESAGQLGLGRSWGCRLDHAAIRDLRERLERAA